MSEPAGLNMSLDALIKKAPAAGGRGGPSAGRGGGRGGSHAGRGGAGRGPKNLAIAGGVQKQQSDRGRGRGAGAQIARGAPTQPARYAGQLQRQNMPQMPKMPPMPMMGMGMQDQFELQQLAMKDHQLKMKEKELQLREREIQLMMAEQRLKAGGGVAKPLGAAQARPGARPFAAAAPAMMVEEDFMEPEEQEMCECETDASGNVVVSLEEIPIVNITAAGEVTLNTGGWWTQETADAMNRVLKHIDISVKVQGDPDDGKWNVIYRGQMKLFHDGFKIPAFGPKSDKRAYLVLKSFNSNRRM